MGTTNSKIFNQINKQDWFGLWLWHPHFAHMWAYDHWHLHSYFGNELCLTLQNKLFAIEYLFRFFFGFFRPSPEYIANVQINMRLYEQIVCELMIIDIDNQIINNRQSVSRCLYSKYCTKCVFLPIFARKLAN